VPQPINSCLLQAEPASGPDTLTVALSDSVDLRDLSHPTNDSERLVFRQLSQTLVRLDCGGRLRPGLASRWTSDAQGLVWTFTRLYPLSSEVVSTWLNNQSDVRALGIDSATALDDRTLRVALGTTRDSGPGLFADPLLAVEHPMTRVQIQQRRVVVSGRPTVDFQMSPSPDPKDALDSGIDLILTRDPTVAEYVSGRSEFTSFALPWSRTYVLLQPAGADLIEGVFGVDSVPLSLIRDVVRAEARPAQAPFWWSGPQACLLDMSLVAAPPRLPRIVYPLSDAVARSIAERIVALATGKRLRAVGLPDADFTAGLHSQNDLGYIIALPREVAAPCYRSRSLPHGARIQPLIDTRARVIVRRGVPPLMVDWDGTIEIGGRDTIGVSR
jgi:hypothetical protein